MDDDLRFREKLFDACADDERLDSLEARMNDFAHVPDRWRTARRPSNVFESDEWLKTDPDVMDEEEYTEWIRMGMYRCVIPSVAAVLADVTALNVIGKRMQRNMQKSRGRRLHRPHAVPKKRLGEKKRPGLKRPPRRNGKGRKASGTRGSGLMPEMRIRNSGRGFCLRQTGLR
jgi:hypothetical protein